MGEFLKQVRNRQVAHPLARGFSRDEWIRDVGEDEADRNLVSSVLAIADVIDILRPQALLGSRNQLLLRALVAYANNQIRKIQSDILTFQDDHKDQPILLDQVILKKHPETQGTLGELTDAAGDSFVFPLRETVDPQLANIPQCSTGKAWKQTLQTAGEQGTLSNKWFLASLFLMDVLWLDAKLVKQTSHQWVLSRNDSDSIGQISGWRRQILIESIAMGFADVPIQPPASTTKTIRCEWIGDFLKVRSRNASVSRESWAHRIYTYASIPKALVSPNIEDIALNLGGVSVTVGEAIRVHSSFLPMYSELFSLFPARERILDTHPREAIRVSLQNLAYVLSELTEIEFRKVCALLEEATFLGRPSETLWGKPLVYAGKDDRFIFLPSLKSSVLRSANQLINKYSETYGRKGLFFQEHCRQTIRKSLAGGPLESRAWISPRAVQSAMGDIDICVLLDDVLILVEAKYFAFPCDAFDYWQVNQTLRAAAEQIKRKQIEVERDREGFLRLLQDRYEAFRTTRRSIGEIVPLIAVADTYHAGYCVEGIPVADMEVLETFFSNKVLQRQELSHDVLRKSGRYLFGDVQAAITGARAYFEHPPMIRDLDKLIESRETNYPTGAWYDGKEIFIRLVGSGLREIPR